MATLGKNQVFEIKNGDGTSFHNLVLRKSAVESIVMSLGDKISGDVYYKDNTLSVTMHEYITYNGVNYMLINPPTIVREGVVSDNSELRGMTKYSFVFYHPMCQLSNFPFTDVAVTSDETRYLSESKVFSWIGKPADFVAKMNKNLVGTEWIVELSSRFPQDKLNELSDVIPFDNATIADACKTFYDTWGVPYVVDKVASTEASYATGKRFKLVMGLPSNEIYENAQAEQQNTPFVFQMGQGVGLKNNSRTPRNNKIITRISGYGSENNIPYGYPQVRWYGTAGQAFTYGDHAGVYTDVTIDGVHLDKVISYPIYKGILDGEYVELIKHPFTRTHLMPSVYRTCLFNKISFLDDNGEFNTDYDPDITLIDYYDAVYSSQYPYPNTINLQAPSYESHEFEDEKPELGEAHIISATPLNKDLTPASSWDDSLDDEGNYNQSYFQIVLPQLSFDLYACASITEEMQINMRSGACLGCTFTVQVDWDDYKRNFYDEEGNFAPNGSQRDLTKYPKSNQGSISLVLQKDNSTFGTLMPNMYQYPKGETSSGAGNGDTFVILGISLPESYILAAEDRLDVDMKSYMLENNEHYFDYPLKFDEDFLFHNENILSQIRPNTVVRFNYAGQTQALFVKQITIKYGEQQLPQYDITLTDNVEVVLNQIGQVAEDVEKLSTLIAILRQSYGKNVWNELAKKLSKTQDDTAAGYITMLKGLQVGANFVPDILGEGGVLRMRDDGKVELVTDILYARVKAYFDSVEIREYKHTGGNRIASVAGNKICRVAWFNSSNVELEQTQANLASVAYFRCYFRASDGEDTVRNNWVVGDQAYCHITSIVNSSDNPEQKGLNQKHLWRLVIGRNTEGTLTEDGEAYIDISNRATETISGNSYTGYQSGSDIPEAQDDIIQLGNVNDTTRQGAIVEFVTGTDAPSYQIYQGINSFSLNNKNQIGFGYNTSTGRAYMNVYGDFRFGARPNTQGSYLEYNSQTGTLNIKAHVEFTNTDQELDTLVQNHQRDDSYDDTEVRGLISGLQEQIDGQIETWFYNYSPVNVDASGAPTSNVPLNVAPYSDWTTDNDKIAHLGDTFTNNSTGYCWRFSRNSSTNAFEWVIIEDSAVITALQNAARAQDTADHKRRVFICDSSHQTPTPPYDAGDLWVNVKYPWATGATYNDEILKCVTSKASGSFAIADWSLANGYTAKLNNFVNNTYSPFAQNIQTQVDKKAETWRQATNPASSWTTEAEKAKHVGDLWMDTANGKKTYIYQNTAAAGATPVYDWVAQDVPDEVFDKIDGKAAIYVGWEDWIVGDVSQLKDKDLYIPNTDHNPYKANKVYRWRASDSTWNEISYTDDTAFNNYINAFLNGTGASGDSAMAAAIQKAIAGALGSGTIVDGGLLLTSLIGMRKNIGTTESPVYETWAGISGQYDDWSGSTHAKGHGIAAWYGGAMVDKEDVQTLPASYAKSLFRFDGSGYLASGNITWNENGSLTIKNITTLSDSNNNNILNELATFNSAFTFGTSGQGSTTALYITPNVPFESLYIGTSNANKKEVATREWVGNNYVSTAFFRQLFRAFKPNATAGQGDVEVEPNTIDVTISNIKAMVGFWTEQYVSALGNSSDGGGGGGGASVLYGLNDVSPNATGDGVLGAQDGYVLTYNGSTHHWYAAATAETYVLPQATANALGGIKIGYNGTTAKTYAVALDTNGKAYVNVPWTDNNTWIPWAGATENAAGTAGYMPAPTSAQRTQFLRGDGTWVSLNNYSLPLATSGARGGVQIGYTTDAANRNYAVQLSSEKMYVNVPWTDTTYSVFVGSGSTAAVGLVPKPSTTAGTTKFLREDATWVEPAYPTNYYASDTTRTKNTVLAAPNGSNGVATFRALVAADIPNLGAGKITSGTFDAARIPDLSSTYAAVGRVDDLEGYFTNGVANDADKLDGNDSSYFATASDVTTLQGYFTDGVANSAAKLTTVSKTAWGQTYWTSGGVPTTISGNMTKVGNISFSATGKNIGSIAYFDTTNSRLGIGTSSPSYKLHVNGTFYASGNSSIGGTFGVTGATTLTGLLTANGGIAIASSKTLKIGDIYLAYDSTNNAIEVYKLDGTNHVAANLYARGGIAALGETSDGGGGGGQGDVTWALLASDQDTRQIAISHLNGVNGVLDILTGYVSSSKNYAVVKDASNHLYVNVPWANDDTKNTAGSTNKAATKLFLVGAESQATNPQTYSNVNVYIGTDNCLYSNGTKVLTSYNDTKNTAGSTDTSSKIFLIGATTQAANPQTYSHDTAYVGTDGCLYSGGTKVLTAHQSLADLMGSTAIGGTTQPVYWNGSAWANTTYTLGASVPSNAVFTDTTYSNGTGLALSSGTFSINSTYQNYISHGESAYNSLSDYLPLSGGTITSSGYTPLTIVSTSNVVCGVKLKIDDSNYGLIEYYPSSSSYGFIMINSNSSSVNYVGIASDGVFKRNNTDIFIHNNNWSSYIGTSSSPVGYSEKATEIRDERNLTGAWFGATVNGVGSGTGAAMYAYGNNPDVFWTNANERMRITGGGDVGIGTNSPSYKLDVNGSFNASTIYQNGVALGSRAFDSTSYLPISGGTLTGSTSINASVSGWASTITNTSKAKLYMCGTSYNGLWVSSAGTSSGDYAFGVSVNDSQLVGGGTCALIVLQNGKIGVGTNSPREKLHINGGCRTNFITDVENGEYFVGACSSGLGSSYKGMLLCTYGSTPIIMYGMTNVGIGVLSPSYKLHVDGDIYATGGVTSLSDIRKKNVVSYELSLNVEQIANAPTIKFLWKDKREEGEQIGTIAQYWQKVLPWVVKDKSNELSMQYGVAALVAAITTARKVVDHEARIKALERENKELREEISRLKIA